ncbi:hypothetical protein CF319_g251 [Tilletia indica]|nr:hypothetical protein CF319_g251 [Tilletia indica]
MPAASTSTSTPSTSSSSLTPLPSTPSSHVAPSTPSVSGSVGPRSRGYPEGMFSTPSRKVVPVIVIPTSEPRADEISGISDGSSLSSLSASGRSIYKTMSPSHFNAVQKRRRINESASPLSRLSRPDDDDDGHQSEDGTSGDETIRDTAQSSKPARKRARRTANESESDAQAEPESDKDTSTDDSDEELPDVLAKSRAANTTRLQPRRTAAVGKTYEFDDRGNYIGTSKPQNSSRIKSATPVPVPVTVSVAVPSRTILKTSNGTNLSIHAMLRRKKEQERQGTDLKGMKEADDLVLAESLREKREADEKKQKAAAEEERRLVESWQRDLDQDFLSPPSKKKGIIIVGDGASGSQGSQTAQDTKASKNSIAALNKRYAEKPEGGCTSDGLDDDDSASSSDLDSDEDKNHPDGERLRSENGVDSARLRMAEQKQRLNGMTRTLKSAAIDGRDVLVDILASDYGLKKQNKKKGDGKKTVKQESKADEAVTGSMWMRGRVALRQISLPAGLETSPFGKILSDATKDGPWALAAALQQIRVMTPRFQISAVELGFLLSVATHGLDLRSGPRNADQLMNRNPSAHPWRLARKERQAVASAACAALECIPCSSAGGKQLRAADAITAVDLAVRTWMVEALVGLGTSTALLKKLRLLSNEVELTLKPSRRVRQQERVELRLACAQSGQQTNGAHVVKREDDQQQGSDSDSLVGWLSLEERLEALVRFCSIIRSLCSRHLLAWPIRVDLYLALAVLSATHPEDGLIPAIRGATAALLDDGQTGFSDVAQQRQEELAERIFTAFETLPVPVYAAMLRGIPKDSVRSRALSRRVAWKLLAQRHKSLRAPLADEKALALAPAPAADAGHESSLPILAMPDLNLLQDLVSTSNDSSPFWISTVADDTRQAAALKRKAVAGGGKAQAKSESGGVTGPTRRVTDYHELAAWTEVVSVALDDLAVQATAFEEAPEKGEAVIDSDPKQKSFPVFDQAAVNAERQVRGSLLLATRPFISLASSHLSATKGSTTNGACPVPDSSRIRILAKISLDLRSTFNKIQDNRGANLEMSRTKDAIQRLQIRLHYLLPFYFASGRVGDEFKLSEIYGEEGGEKKGLGGDGAKEAVSPTPV